MLFGLDEKDRRNVFIAVFIFSYFAISVFLYLPRAFAEQAFSPVFFLQSIPKLAIVKVAASCLIVFVLSLLPSYDLDNIKTKEVGDGQHGSARWATAAEIEKSYSIIPIGKQTVPGLIVGKTSKTYTVDTSDKSMMILAPPGAGKSKSVIIPSIYYNATVNTNTGGKGASMIITDLKGELLQATGNFLISCGYKVLYLNLRDPFRSYCFNLLNNVNVHMDKYLSAASEREKLISYARAERYAKILSQSIVNSVDVDSKSDTSSYFNETAQGLLTGIILLVSEYGEADQRHLLSVFNLIIELNGTEGGEANPQQKNKLAEMLENIENDRIKSYVGAAMSADVRTSMNIFSSALGKLVGLIDAELEQMISRHSPEINHIDFIHEPTAIFIICPDENPTRYFFVSLFMRYFLNDLIEQARNASSGQLSRQVINFWDEFGVLPPVKDVDALFAAARSAGIRFAPALQSLAQLEKSYNKNTAKIIRETCQITLTTYVSPLARETAEEISKVLNNRTVQSGSISMGKSGSQTIQMMSKPLLSTDEIIYMPQGDFIVIKSGVRPMRTHLDLYSDYLPECEEIQYITQSDISIIRKMSEANIRSIPSRKEYALEMGMFDH